MPSEAVALTVASVQPFQEGKQQSSGVSSSKPQSDDPAPPSRPDGSNSQPHRILGIMPNYRSVGAGVIPPPPTFRRNFIVATHQAFDYSSFVFLGITSLAAEAQNAHPVLGKGVGGYYAYTWRGFLDKTDNTYLSAFILPSILHEDGRYYAMGTGSKWKRLAYSASRVVITRTYSGRQTFNFAGIGGKIGTQAVSTTYYPPSAASFGTLSTKFAYSIARDVGFTVFREFYPDIATHILHRHP